MAANVSIITYNHYFNKTTFVFMKLYAVKKNNDEYAILTRKIQAKSVSNV